MRFSILGTIEVRQDSHVVRLSGAMQQTLLAALLVSDGTLLTVDALMEELCGTTPPSKGDNALHAQISRLRRSLARLEPGRTESRIATSASGYQIVIDRTELDAWTFVDAIDSVRTRAETGADADTAACGSGSWAGPAPARG